MRKKLRLLAALLLCALLLPGNLAWATEADSGEETSLASPVDPNSIIDGTVMTSKIQKVLEEICPLSARVVVNEVSMKMEHERITKLVKDLKKIVSANQE